MHATRSVDHSDVRKISVFSVAVQTTLKLRRVDIVHCAAYHTRKYNRRYQNLDQN